MASAQPVITRSGVEVHIQVPLASVRSAEELGLDLEGRVILIEAEALGEHVTVDCGLSIEEESIRCQWDVATRTLSITARCIQLEAASGESLSPTELATSTEVTPPAPTHAHSTPSPVPSPVSDKEEYCYRIESTDDRGACLVATREISPGELILQESPYATCALSTSPVSSHST